jgi:hypothetical protein
MLIEAIREAVAPRLHAHDEKIAEHDVVIQTIQKNAPFLRDMQDFITTRQGALELGIDPALMPEYPQSRLTICAIAGRTLTNQGAETGASISSRLDGSAVVVQMNTYRRQAVYAALRELASAEKSRGR